MNHTTELFQHCEETRQSACGVERSIKSAKGQFLTPIRTARFMSSLFQCTPKHVRILDPGAGSGILFSALVSECCSRKIPPDSISVVAYENDLKMIPQLSHTVELCAALCRKKCIRFCGTVKEEDFILSTLEESKMLLFEAPNRFSHVILNPPYKKITGQSVWRKKLDAAKKPVSNLYAAFTWLAMELLDFQGELVAITPRSFCNGPYFRQFRKSLTKTLFLDFFHLYHSRNVAFSEDSVLQENVIFHAIKGVSKKNTIISVSADLDYEKSHRISVPCDRVVLPNDRDCFIHLPENKKGYELQNQTNKLENTLENLNINVSTGKVVDFRNKNFLLHSPVPSSIPLIYPCHLFKGEVRWPVDSQKPNALIHSEKTEKLSVPCGNYLLVKRFTAKEELRRVVAAICSPDSLPYSCWGFENHLNFFHHNGLGLDLMIAKGLFIYLNSTFFDRYFRLFSGHTQINATDLRKIKYPTRRQLERLGEKLVTPDTEQERIDDLLRVECDLYAR